MAHTYSLDERRAVGLDPQRLAPARSADEPTGRREPRADHRWIAVLAAGSALVAAFVAHLAAYGAWIVDDAGISMAYAANVAHGHGLVAAPGASHVEGFSNPLWVAILAVTVKTGLLGRGAIVGIPSYVAVSKGLAVLLHCVVLLGLGVTVRRIITVARGGQDSFGATLACWIGAGLLLAANPSYVIWMGSGLENPLLAAEVSVLAAVVASTMPRPTTRSMVAIGALVGAAALTRPDGLVYVVVLPIVALLASGNSRPRRWALLGAGALTFGAVFGAYLAFRLSYFGAWIPNTAIAKGQGLPTLRDLVALDDLGASYGWLMVALTTVGALVAWRRMRDAKNVVGCRVVGAVAGVLAASLAAYVALARDWMTEYRFLTPAWPLLSAATMLAIAALVSSARRPAPVRFGIAAVAAVVVLTVMPSWWDRASAFREAPTVPLCSVAERFAANFDADARALGLDPRSTSVLLPDVGGMLLASHLQVVDLAGLVDRPIARFINRLDRAGLADYVFDDLEPTFIQLHGIWGAASGVGDDPRLRRDYVAIYRHQDWVRRDALAHTNGPDPTLAHLRAATKRAEAALEPRSACGTTLLSPT